MPFINNTLFLTLASFSTPKNVLIHVHFFLSSVVYLNFTSNPQHYVFYYTFLKSISTKFSNMFDSHFNTLKYQFSIHTKFIPTLKSPLLSLITFHLHHFQSYLNKFSPIVSNPIKYPKSTQTSLFLLLYPSISPSFILLNLKTTIQISLKTQFHSILLSLSFHLSYRSLQSTTFSSTYLYTLPLLFASTKTHLSIL